MPRPIFDLSPSGTAGNIIYFTSSKALCTYPLAFANSDDVLSEDTKHTLNTTDERKSNRPHLTEVADPSRSYYPCNFLCFDADYEGSLDAGNLMT